MVLGNLFSIITDQSYSQTSTELQLSMNFKTPNETFIRNSFWQKNPRFCVLVCFVYEVYRVYTVRQKRQETIHHSVSVIKKYFYMFFLNLHNIHNLIILFSLIYKSLELALKTKR